MAGPGCGKTGLPASHVTSLVAFESSGRTTQVIPAPKHLVLLSSRSMVANICSVFEQPDGASAREQLDRVVDDKAARFPASPG